MNNLKNYVNWKLTHADKTAEAEGYPLVLENCKSNKRMKQLEVYGNSVQEGENLYDASKATSGVYLNDSGIEVVSSDGSTSLSDYISVFDKTNYSIDVNNPLSSGALTLRINFFDANLIWISQTKYSIAKGTTSQKFTIPESINYIRVSYYNKSSSPIVYQADPTPDAPIEVQSVGELVTDVNDANYGKYKIPLLIKGDGEAVSHNIYLNEPLRKIGDYADYVDFKENKVVRKVGRDNISDIPFNGKSGVSTANQFFASYTISSGTLKSKGFINTSNSEQHDVVGGEFCEKLPVTSYGYIRNNNDVLGMVFTTSDNANTTEIRVGVPKSIATTLDDFRAWVKELNCNIYYVLLNQSEEPITCELPKLNAKTTIIEVDTGLAPSDAYGKYIKR